MKKIILISTLANLLILGIHCSYSQNVGINNSGTTPNSSALLDIDAAGMSPKGLLIPRIALTSATDAATIATPATSLLVYNTNGGLSPAGYYYNQGTSGSPNWVAFLTNNVNAPSAWLLTGNTGTTGGPNFLGTTDNISLRFRTNNTQKMIIDSLGNVGIGTTAPNTLLDINGSVAWRENSLSLSNGVNNNIAIGNNSFFRIIGPTGAFSITGLTGGLDGRIVTLYNSTSQPLTIVNDATSTAANRIYTLTGSDIITASSKSAIQLQYNSSDSRWLVISSQNTPGTGSSVPIGSIIAWHKSFANTPALPSGWVQCDGQTLSDAGSVYNGQVIPNLNSNTQDGSTGSGMFLRGASTSGTKQADATAVNGLTAGGFQNWGGIQNCSGCGGTDYPIGISSTDTETRPANMTVVWIMRVK